MSISPAEQAFDEWRTKRMNRYYYEKRYSRAQSWSRFADIVTLVAVAMVGGGLWFVPTTSCVEAVLAFLGLVATISAGVSTIFRPAEKAATYETYVALYEYLDYALETIVRRARIGTSSATLGADLELVLAAEHQLQLRRIDDSTDHDLLVECQNRVLIEIPDTYFANNGG